MASWDYQVNSTTEYQDSVELTGLSPNTPYCYAVFSTDTSGAVNLLPASQNNQTFTTLAPASTTSTKSVTFDVIGDTGENYAETGGSAASDVPFNSTGPPINPDQAAIDHEIGGSNAQFLLVAGDVGYSGGTSTNYGDLQQTGTDPEVSNIFGPSYFPQTGGIPTFVAEGNHGQNVNTLRVWPSPVSAESSGGTYDFDSYSNGIDGTPNASFPDSWYAFSTGNVRIYVLDAAWGDTSVGTASGSECGTNASACTGYQADADQHWTPGSAEYQWLQNDLATHPGGVKFAVFHFPLRSDNDSQPSDPYLENDPSVNPNASTSLEALLASNGVDIAFNGHAHTYQRFVPKSAGQVISYVTGGGGGVLEPVQGGSTCTDAEQNAAIYALGWSPSSGNGTSCGAPAPGSAADVYNFLKVTVTGTTVEVDPTNAAGNVFDRQVYTFGTSSGTTPTTPGFVTAAALSSSRVQLTWTPSTEAGQTISYSIKRNGLILATGVTGTTFVDSNVSPGTLYTYTVTAVDSSLQTSAAGTSNKIATPTPPGSVTAVATSAGSVQLNWSPSSETGGTIDSYQILRNDGVSLGPVSGATTYTDGSVQPGTTYTYSVTAVDGTGGSSTSANSNPVTTPQPPSLPFSGPPLGPVVNTCMSHLPAGSVTGSAVVSDGSGYYEVDAQGDVAAFGGAVCYGSMTGTPLNRPIVGMAIDPATGGYWLVATDGGIFAFDAPFFGSTGNIHLNQPIVGMSGDRSGNGYWMVASDGGIFAFGDAPFLGSTGNIHLNKPVVGMAVDPATGGYWLVATDGGIFSFGAAPFYGSTGNIHLNQPIVGMAPLADGSGYRLIASDGGVFDFNAPFYGSTGNIHLNRPIIGGLDDPVGDGYWLIASDGGVFSFDAPFLGSAA
jgi:hypothetical protein